MAGPQKESMQAIQVVVAAAVSVVLKAAGPRPRRCHQFTVMQVTQARGRSRLRDEDVLGARPKAPRQKAPHPHVDPDQQKAPHPDKRHSKIRKSPN